MAGKLVITTGSSCCGRKEKFFPELEILCDEKNTKLKMHNIGDMIPEWAWKYAREELPSEEILYVNKMAMNFAQGGVFQKICYSLERDLNNFDAVFINLHTLFPWWKGNIYIPVYNEILMKLLIEGGFIPDMFVCFIDNANDTLRRLKEKTQWKGENLSEKDIWLWQNEEVNNSRRLTHFFEKKIKFFVMPIRQPVETLWYLLFEPWRLIIYIQMPLTYLNASELRKVVNFIKELRKLAVVFDPMTIETGIVELEELDKADDEAEIMVRHTQTGYRDTEWFVPQVDVCLAYYVELVLTFGTVDETATAAGRGKKTWAIFPTSTSPFLPFRVPPERIFKNAEECLTAFKAYAEEIEKDYKERNGIVQAQTKEGENA